MRILCRIIGGSHTIKSYSKLTPSAEAIMSQYRLFAMGKDDSADLIAKCPKCGTQIGIVILYRPPLPVAAAVQCGISRKI